MIDFLGNDIQVGDKVVYAYVRRGGCELKRATVTKLSKDMVKISYPDRYSTDGIREFYTVSWRIVKIMPE